MIRQVQGLALGIAVCQDSTQSAASTAEMDPIATIKNNIPKLSHPDTVADAAAAIGEVLGAAVLFLLCCCAAANTHS